jgi:DNA repair exonuclease SbcCD ATPase subunit
MGDKVREVHNLSGGERFLVSPALALGLASMSSAQGIRVDSLFIGEGFGALDRTTRVSPYRRSSPSKRPADSRSVPRSRSG